MAYWIFSSAVFGSDQPLPTIAMFPDYRAALDKLLKHDPESQIIGASGTTQAAIVLGLWLHANGHVRAGSATSDSKDDEPNTEFMACIHSLTLIALYHPVHQVRNAASVLAGSVLHADPGDDDRLHILYDLLENCDYAQLKALAVTWLREEIIEAAASGGAGSNLFTTPQALETVQYAVFPSVVSLRELDIPGVVDLLAQNSPFLLQAVNFALFLWGSDKWKHILPGNMASTVMERWFRPVQDAVETVERAILPGGELANQELGPLHSDLVVLRGRMKQLGETDGFKVFETAGKD